MKARGLAALFALTIGVGLTAATAQAGKSGGGGAAIYAANCAYCHGAAGLGDGPNAAKLSPKPANLATSRLGEGEIAGIVRNGRRSCPSWKSSLTESDVQAVAAFTRTLQH